MVEDIRTYEYAFEPEVETFMVRLGALADKILFINIGTDPHNRKRDKRAFVEQIIGDEKLQALTEDDVTDALEVFARRPGEASAALPAFGPDISLEEYKAFMKAAKEGTPEDITLAHMVFINENQFCNDHLGEKFEALLMLHTFYHEAGHALMSVAQKADKLHPHDESQADAFSALLLLQRFGEEAIPFLQAWGQYRATNAVLYGDTAHLTSTVLDKIIFDSQHEDFSKLAIDDIIARSKTYAAQWSPDATALKKARRNFRFIRFASILKPMERLLNSTSLSGYAPDNLAFYVIAKSIAPTLYPELRLEDMPPPTASETARAKRLMDHAGNMKFSGLFNNAAADAAGPSLAEMIMPRAAHRPQGITP